MSRDWEYWRRRSNQELDEAVAKDREASEEEQRQGRRAMAVDALFCLFLVGAFFVGVLYGRRLMESSIVGALESCSDRCPRLGYSTSQVASLEGARVCLCLPGNDYEARMGPRWGRL